MQPARCSASSVGARTRPSAPTLLLQRRPRCRPPQPPLSPQPPLPPQPPQLHLLKSLLKLWR